MRMFKAKKVKSKKDDIRTEVVASAAIANVGVANGRNIPVVIVEDDLDGKISNLITTHEAVANGSCSSQWGMTEGNEYAILVLSFITPVEQKLILFFDVIKYGIIVNQILYSKCMYLMTGDRETKFSQHLSSPRILLEVPCDDFEKEWKKIYKKEYVKYLQKEYKLSKKVAEKVFDEMHDQMDTVKKLRMK
jgi:hypothetical protein